MWDNEPNPNAGDPAPKPPKDEGKVYTEEQVKRRLQGQGKQLEELQRKLETYEAKEANARQADRKRKEEEAKKRGEFEALYAEQQSRAEKLEAELQSREERIKGYEQMLQTEVDEQLSAVDDDDAKKRWKNLLKDRPVLEQRSLLTELMRAAGVSGNQQPSTPSGGPPGPPKAPTIDDLKKDPGLRREYAAKQLASLERGNS